MQKPGCLEIGARTLGLYSRNSILDFGVRWKSSWGLVERFRKLSDEENESKWVRQSLANHDWIISQRRKFLTKVGEG